MAKVKMTREKEPKHIAAFLNTKVSDLTARGGKSGELYGLELEVEGFNVQMGGKAIKGWLQVEEGSLRGENIEYTFSAPCTYEESVIRVNRLFEAFDAAGVHLKNSYRCSTHVHLNFSGQNMKHVANFFILYTIIEQLLEEYCGEMRRGNVFCLSNRDAEPIVEYFEQACLLHLNLMNFGENIRYCGLNLAALNKFGSIEIRTMRGADNPQMVIEWINILRNLYQFTEKMIPPSDLIEQISIMGVQDWLRSIFSEENYDRLMATWPPERNLQASIYQGIRLVQVLAYRLDEAYRIEITPEEKVKRVKRAHRELRITDGEGSVYHVPPQYSEGTAITGIRPRVIIYDEDQDRWYQYIDARGHHLEVKKRWYWTDELDEIEDVLDEEEEDFEDERERDEDED